MSIMISSLIKGMDQLEMVAKAVNQLHDPGIGIELIAFTHDDGYWNRLNDLVGTLTCPITFHGPYIKTEGTSEEGTEAYDFLMESYRRTINLARDCGAMHVVYHTTQINYAPDHKDCIAARRVLADRNADTIIQMGRDIGVEVLVENLPCPRGRLPLYNNQGYFDFFDRNPDSHSLIDIGHAHMNGLDLEAFLKRFGSRVRGYHFHNNDGVSDLHNDIMDGTFDYEAFAALYRQYSPTANIVLEYEPHVQITMERLLTQVEFVRSRYGA